MRRPVAIGFGVLAAAIAAAAAAWAVDSHRYDGRVARHVVLGSRDLGGMRPAAVGSAVDRFAEEFRAAAVRVRAPGGGVDTDAQTIGLAIDRPATARAATAVGRRGAPWSRWWSWARSLLGHHRRVPVNVSVDRAAVARTIAEKDTGPRADPVEPRVEWRKDAFHVVAGKPGRGIDPDDVVDALPGAVAEGVPVAVHVDRGEIAPRFSDADAHRLLDRAAHVTAEGLAVVAGKASATLPASTVRSWLTSEASPDGLRLALVPNKVVADLAKALPNAGDPPVDAKFTVDGSGVHIAAGRAGTACCAPEAEARVAAALLGAPGGPAGASTGAPPGAAKPVDLPLKTRQPDLTVEKAQALRITSAVGSFTTNHACCEARVTNIHRIADLVRGAVIQPGRTFSVNGYVGRRTTDKGFVSAPIIGEGNTHAEDVGGGVSQFATTLFNAAFFAGLDFGEYQAHTLYISRYPYGREATMGYPHPDLQVKNTTPYGVLIWPTYTGTSLTVTLYSTRYATGQQTAQTTAPAGACTRVTTERTRTYADGHTAVDHVYATYAPGDGKTC